eukprot:2202843-Rhodomonas_salina.1
MSEFLEPPSIIPLFHSNRVQKFRFEFGGGVSIRYYMIRMKQGILVSTEKVFRSVWQKFRFPPEVQ